ncbi:LysR family transcriptional regulator [Acidovorax sp. CCYZU-2555]|uniref:LysR family transcriptional regulator n=1 Tax=Acidovorax sp. CCYZU-2555 TaxID=2835042 RepID=UPI001BCE70AD|nr:LysR family transcriptional regulator [Acidovorax sp. CCYZU-2555]MBS7777559.1 LysR family transcriptional regulator [Acidovorax sp. CCYZU-2555]
MFTFKQIEAVYWIAKTGSFVNAAEQLHTTQAGISKRIKEIEQIVGESLFDRSGRKVRLTAKGSILVQAAESLLRQRQALMDELVDPKYIDRVINIGVTELVSSTWLSRYLIALHARFPQLSIRPHVDFSADLLAKADAQTLDLIVIPRFSEQPGFVRRELGPAQFEWLGSPGVKARLARRGADEPWDTPLLMQGNGSGLGFITERYLQGSQQLGNHQVLRTNSLLPLVGMTLAGQGVSFLPTGYLRQELEAGRLVPVDTGLSNDAVVYDMLYRQEQQSELFKQLAELAYECCDFSASFLT